MKDADSANYYMGLSEVNYFGMAAYAHVASLRSRFLIKKKWQKNNQVRFAENIIVFPTKKILRASPHLVNLNDPTLEQ